MTIIKSLAPYVLAGAILALAVVLLIQPAPNVEGASAPMAPALTVATSTTQTFSVTTSARVAATTTNPLDPANSFIRAYTSICNPNANPVYLNFDADKPTSVTAYTTVIAAAAGYNACYELIDSKMVYNGSITASSTNQTATVISVKQYVY